MANPLTVASMQVCAASGNVTSESAFCQAPGNTVRAYCAAPITLGNMAFDGRLFALRAAILITGGTTTNYTPSVRLYSGNNTGLTTFTSDTAIITPSAFAVNSVTRLWVLEAKLYWDPTSARLNGYYQMAIDTTYTSPVTLTAGLSSGVTTESALQWCLTGLFSASNGSNTAILKYFEMDLY
jgi:hypothetical protein